MGSVRPCWERECDTGAVPCKDHDLFIDHLELERKKLVEPLNSHMNQSVSGLGNLFGELESFG